MIKIKEEKPKDGSRPKIYLNVENRYELIQDSYPIFIKPKNLTHLVYDASILEKK